MPELDGQLPDFYRCIFEQIVEVEKLGFDHAWVIEHHFGGYGGTLPHPPTFLSAVAQRTSRIRLGVAVAVLPLHRPIDLAEQYAMADVVSNGRMISASAKAASRWNTANSARARMKRPDVFMKARRSFARRGRTSQ